MNIRIHCQGMSESPWMKEYISGKLVRLERYLSPQFEIVILFFSPEEENRTEFEIHSFHQQFCFTSKGEDLYEAFTRALDLALRELKLHHQKVMNKVHQKFPEGDESTLT